MSEKEVEAQLTLKDRLNYPYFIGHAILTNNKAILSEYSEKQIIEATKNLRSLIPESWEDEKFKEDLEKAQIKKKTDIRPFVAGNTRMSEEACKEHGIPCFKEEKSFDYEKLRMACINLFDRRGLTARRIFTERVTGKTFKGDNLANSEIEEL